MKVNFRQVQDKSAKIGESQKSSDAF